MGLERNLSAVAPTLLTADGGTEGQVQLASTLGLFVKQIAILQAPLLPPLNVEIKRVLSETNILVGPASSNMSHRINVSLYTVVAGSFLFACDQPKAVLSMESRLYASYIQEPVNGWRIQPVDSFGNSFDSTHPLPVTFDGTISIGKVEIVGSTGNVLEPKPDGSLDVNVSALTTFQTSQYMVGTSAVQITPSPLSDRGSISFKAQTTSSAVIFIGNSSSVDITTGYALFNGESLQMDLKNGEPIYAISGSDGQTLYVLELGA